MVYTTRWQEKSLECVQVVVRPLLDDTRAQADELEDSIGIHRQLLP
jgi:hypothetical protein